ncbi:hypothetical protein [Mesorhizobium sp. CAU 1741]|uniref:hypothetical protein n=1 Tax=Mesorhizobium sp. CAU 1741 TaxID=3140366 RepID=UPI00325B31C5
MAVNPSASGRTAILTALRDLVADGTLELISAGNAVLAVFQLTDTGGTIDGDDWEVAFDATEVVGTAAAGAGVNATAARFKDSGGNIDISGLTVGLTGSGADIELGNVSITEDQPVELTSSIISYPGA